MCGKVLGRLEKRSCVEVSAYKLIWDGRVMNVRANIHNQWFECLELVKRVMKIEMEE